ncbi:MAG: glutathione S-transferase family protein [Notoacmeibacter sp.]|nr:glutathione S-transferase family protein [Notoacmeibacter sp.]MCC0033106.1 glutathione S-transferase family protein [Brucellaceae bacterium]
MTIRLYDLVGSDHARPFSPHCWKVAMALAHKGLDFETVPTPFTKVPAVEGGVSKTIPVINDKGQVVADSFAIAEYLEDTYPDRPSLFGGEGGRALSRFVESWSQLTIHPYLVRVAIMDIHDFLEPADQAYFRTDREGKFGRPLEEVRHISEEAHAAFLASLNPLRTTLKRQPFIGGQSPLFADYIVFGAFQWVRVVSPFAFLPDDDPVADWFGRCLDLHDGLGRKAPACG